MRRTLGLCLLTTALLSGCSNEKPQPVVVVVPQPPAPAPAAAVAPAATVPVAAVAPAPPPAKLEIATAGAIDVTAQDRYDAALFDALNQLADKKYAEALTALEAARAARDTDQVRQEIDKVRGLIDQKAAAERTAGDITAILSDGNAAEAATLATTALSQFRGSDVTEALERAKRQADALAGAALEDAAARRSRFLGEADAARRDNNLRAAVIALEQIGEDAEARRQLDEVRAALTRYDDARARAARLRRDPAQLEDALAALDEARQAWDTPQVRSEIEDYTLALQQRRDRLSVADFEVRGEVGVPLAGRTVAERLLPAFKSRFDLVEREQVGKILDELRLESSAALEDPVGRQEVARLARVRYLVVGSLTPLNGVTVQARLVEVRTGLVAQTASLSAPTLEALLPQLPKLARVLLMSDEQKLAYEQAQAQQAVPVVEPIAVTAALPPPPPPYVANDPPPPPVVTYTPAPLPVGGLVIQDFAALPAVGVAVAAPAVVVVEDDPRRKRLLALSLEIGDNLFRRGRHKEAQRHFELALSLTTKRADIEVRIDRCRPFLPPVQPPVVVVPPPAVVVQPAPAVVVVAPPPPVVRVVPPRQRIVVFNFLVNAQPGLVPPAVGEWAADQFASYWGAGYDVVERGEVCWYMGRLGVTMRDVLADANARRCLAQALNVRFLVFGAIEQTHSFNVSTHLIDAETGERTGTGTIHVQDHNELKLRMHELARQTGAPPAEQARIAQQGRDSEKALTEARRLQQAGDFARAAEVAGAALQAAPGNVALQSVLNESQQRAKQAAFEAARKQEAARRAAEMEAARRRAAELAREAEAARAKAAAEANKRDAAARRAQEQERLRAYERLEAQARAALKAGRYAEAIPALQGALAIKATEEDIRDLARARTAAEAAERARAAEEKKQRELAELKQRELAQERVRQEAERQRAAEAARRERDAREAKRLTDQAREAIARQDFAAALAAATSAARVSDTPETKAFIHEVEHEQELAEARKKGEQARREAERKLAEEKARRDKAEAEARQKQDAYNAALARGQKELGERRYDQAIAAYQDAAKLYRTDVALDGIKQAEQARDHAKAEAEAEKRRQAEAARTAARVKDLMAAGRQSLEAKQFDKAVQEFRDASGLIPADVEVRTALEKAIHARDEARAAVMAAEAAAARKREDEARAARAAADAAAARKREDEMRAAKAAEAAAARKREDEARAAKAAADDRAMRQRKANYDKAMQAGREAWTAKNYTAAANAFAEAVRVEPNDNLAVRSLNDARAALEASRTPPKPAPQPKPAAPAQPAPKPPAEAPPATKPQPAPKPVTETPPVPKPQPAPAPAPMPPVSKPAPAPVTPPPAPKPAAPPPVNPAAEYGRHMQAGADLDKQKKFAESAAQYREALRYQPGDAKATAALRAAEFGYFRGEAYRQHTAKKFDQAVKDYEEALKRFPNDADTKALLQKAKDHKLP